MFPQNYLAEPTKMEKLDGRRLVKDIKKRLEGLFSQRVKSLKVHDFVIVSTYNKIFELTLPSFKLLNHN